MIEFIRYLYINKYILIKKTYLLLNHNKKSIYNNDFDYKIIIYIINNITKYNFI